MQVSKLITWENRLTWLSFILLCLVTAYGIFTGAIISMYYEIIANINALADNLAPVQAFLYLLATLCGLFHLPFALTDLRYKFWRQAALRFLLGFSPLLIAVGTDGLIAHSLWWLPLSETNRFHVLHHTLFVSFPLTCLYGVLLRWSWQPKNLRVAPNIQSSAWLISGLILLVLFTLVSVLMGGFSLALIGQIILIGGLMLFVVWRMGSKFD